LPRYYNRVFTWNQTGLYTVQWMHENAAIQSWYTSYHNHIHITIVTFLNHATVKFIVDLWKSRVVPMTAYLVFSIYKFRSNYTQILTIRPRCAWSRNADSIENGTHSIDIQHKFFAPVRVISSYFSSISGLQLQFTLEPP
jgi:hypothetical protein